MLPTNRLILRELSSNASLLGSSNAGVLVMLHFAKLGV
jgi:hypothetical protein